MKTLAIAPRGDLMHKPHTCPNLLTALAFLLIFCVSPGFCAPLRVGVIQALSGDGANPGISFNNGFSLAIEQFDDIQRSSIEFIFEDDQMSPKNTLTAYKRLRSLHDIKAVVTFSSGTSNALAPITESDGIPHIAVGSDPAISNDRKFVMNFMTMPDVEMRLMVATALERGYRRIARISTVQEGTLALREAFDTANAGRMEIVLDEEYAHDQRDFRPFINKLKRLEKVDGVFANFLFGQAGVFSRQLREAGVKLQLFSHHCFEDPGELKISNGALLGAWYVNPDSPSDEFLKSYQLKFPDQPVSFAGYGYDLSMLLSSAAIENKSPLEINKFLHSVKDFKGVLGTYSADKTAFTLPAVLKMITEAGFIRISAEAVSGPSR